MVVRWFDRRALTTDYTDYTERVFSRVEVENMEKRFRSRTRTQTPTKSPTPRANKGTPLTLRFLVTPAGDRRMLTTIMRALRRVAFASITGQRGRLALRASRAEKSASSALVLANVTPQTAIASAA